MLSESNVLATIAVKDIEAARKFYGDVLGLKPVPTDEAGVLSYRSGSSEILIYESQHAGTNKATAATWVIDRDLDGLVRDLRAKGVWFEHYDLPDTRREGDVHVSGNTRVAWLKDPEGNILSVVSSGQK